MKKIILISLLATLMNTVMAAGDQTEVCASNDNDPRIAQAVKWYNQSNEKEALYNQTYNLATAYVQYYFNTRHPKPRTWGVILAIDETVLDNSWYYVACNQLPATESTFYRFIANAKRSTALPGAVKFTHMIHNLGGYVSLVSNRDGTFNDESGNVMNSTIDNLNAANIYFDQVVLVNAKMSADRNNKNPRFKAISSGKYNTNEMVWSTILPAHKIIAYIGDNIQDFPNLRQDNNIAHDVNSPRYKSFGAGYFMVPNPIYGSWNL